MSVHNGGRGQMLCPYCNLCIMGGGGGGGGGGGEGQNPW